MNVQALLALPLRRTLIVAGLLLIALSAPAQYYYPATPAYPYGYQYSAPQPQYQQQPYSYPYTQQPQYQPQPQARPSVSGSPYDRIPVPNGEADPSQPVEIWLGKKIGRWGDYWFPALGGRPTHPTPTGKFTVNARHEEFYSRKYKAEMPRSVFFTEQCAIHVGSLKTNSHGCIHVDWEAGQLIYDRSKDGATKIIVHP